MFIERQIKPTIQQHREWFRIVYLGGPRQSGKTTLLRNLAPELPYASLEEADTRFLAEEDPRRFLNAYPQGAILDEAQRVPQLFNYLQTSVDEYPSRRFLLSGSQNFLLMESITQSLAGRVGLLQLFPFSHAELLHHREKPSLDTFCWRGGYPALHQLDSSMPPSIFFDNYIQTYLERDVRAIKNIGNLTQFSRFLRLCAGRVGQPLNLSNLANDVGVAVNTIKAWMSVLEASYLVFTLAPYFENFNKRIIKSPKLYFFDTGLLCYLLGISQVEQLAQHYHYGSIVENAIIAELYKKRSNAGQRPHFWFWQDQSGHEVDLLIEENGHLKAIEIKASQTYNPRLESGLKHWQQLTQNPKDQNFLVYAGEQNAELAHGSLLSWEQGIGEL
jgi:uncharacterized protein